MNIGAIIREKRLACGLTQEQVAQHLGITAPAVNKWEKGSTYPDITLLPPLARLLHTDLNTLLCFQEEPDEQAVGLAVNQLQDIAASEGMRAALAFAEDKIREYPHCAPLLLSLALTLEGLSVWEPCSPSDDVSAKIEGWYRRAALCSDPMVSSRAQAMLIAKYTRRGDYDKAATLLNELPDAPPCHKQELQAVLLMEREQWDAAAVLLEKRLLALAADLNGCLMSLTEIAVRQERYEDATYMAQVSRQCSDAFDGWEFAAYGAMFQIAAARRDETQCIAVLQEMLSALLHPPISTPSPLRRHMPPADRSNSLGKALLSKLIDQAEQPDAEEYAFLRQSSAFRHLAARIKEHL